jgi:hypothetical protein
MNAARASAAALALASLLAAQSRHALDAETWLFVPASLAPTGGPIDVVFHLHGSHDLAQSSFAARGKDAVLVSFHRDGLSSVYTAAFADPNRFPALLAAAFQKLATLVPARPATPGQVVVSAFSAGYAGVREFLKTASSYDRIDAIALGDALHASYVAPGVPDPNQLAGFARFARDAALGRKRFLFSHSAIVPGSYASTTECADALIAAVGGRRALWSGTNALGMRQTSRCELGGFAVHGFAGTTAPDHTDHFAYVWRMLDALPFGCAFLGIADPFVPAGRRRDWIDKFTPASVVPFAPPAPAGDGHVLLVHDPAGGYESARIGCAFGDGFVEAWVYCEYRPRLLANGFERCGVFVRDDGNGGFDGTTGGGGSCYALAWDSGDGRLWCMRTIRGAVQDLAPAPIRLPSTAWRRFRIEARQDRLRFLVDGVPVLEARDATHASGVAGIGYHEFFASNANMLGTRAESFRADVFVEDR